METKENERFIKDETIAWHDLGGGVKRKIVAYNANLMMVKVAFLKGAIGAVHQHRHVQITHIESGRFEVEIEGEKKILQQNDGFYIPPNVPHGVVCLEAGVLIDTFNPAREDFITNKV